MIPDLSTTIAAPASGTGGAISIIRVSGDLTIKICTEIFRPSDSKKNISELPGYSVLYGDILDGKEVLDDVLLTLFRSPHSYTGEDSAEISCHASPYIKGKILDLIVKAGGTIARPGEFTQRAFLNGRLDLTQAEAVADLIASGTKAAHRLATHQMRGGFSEDIVRLREDLLKFASLIELELDFSEEDVEFADRSELKRSVEEVKTFTDQLASSFRLGNAIKNGLPVAIVGKPNAGKSTLLNSILKDDRAIVSEIPGTTRDVIEDTIIINDLLYRFIDTAGIRETADIIENLGIRKTYQKIEQALVVLLITEATDKIEVINESVNAIKSQIDIAKKKLIIVVNKSDLAGKGKIEQLKGALPHNNSIESIIITATDQNDIEGLKTLIESVSGLRQYDENNSIVTNYRHYEALTKCSESLSRVIEGLNSNLPHDLVSMDLRQGIYYLGEIIGEINADDILGNIFKNFCIGK